MTINMTKVRQAVANYERKEQITIILRELLDDINHRGSTPLHYTATSPSSASLGCGNYRSRRTTPILANSDR